MPSLDPLPAARQAGFRPWTLDALNFLLADVRGALGPFLTVFLVTQLHWSQSRAGVVTTVGGLLALLVQTPAGALIDAVRAKRTAIAAALAAVGVGGAAIFALPAFWPVLAANALISVVGDLFGPAVSALTLGLYPAAALARRLARNSAWDHAGNVAVALAAGAVGSLAGQRAVFLLSPALALLGAAVVFKVPGRAIDHRLARGGTEAAHGGWRQMLACRPLLVFAGCTVLFHLANAPLLPLVGQKLAARHPREATAMMSACIVAAQAIMLPVALLVGRAATRLGRKPVLLAAFGVLPARALLYLASDNSAWLIGVQLLDGVGAGLLGAVTPLVVADLMRGTGRFNAAQGLVATAQGLGASVSGVASGVLVDRAGYGAAFGAAAGVAAAAFLVLLARMPETGQAAAAGSSR